MAISQPLKVFLVTPVYVLAIWLSSLTLALYITWSTVHFFITGGHGLVLQLQPGSWATWTVCDSSSFSNF